MSARNDNRLYQILKRMENELTALKTAHNRGLGAFSFDSVRVQCPTVSQQGGLVSITVKIKDGEDFPCMIQALPPDNPISALIQEMTISHSNRTYTFAFDADREASGTTFLVLSSSLIESVTIEVENV